jgi:aminocarboxymuconate-semialdehyde decarboxylase
MTIDMHSHYYGGLVDGLARRTVRPTVTINERGQRLLNAMTASTIMSAGYTDLAARLSYMDATDIDTQLLTFPGALGVDVMPIAEALPIVRDYNDQVATICGNSAGRFIGLGGLPLDDMLEAAAEMYRVRRSLRMPGAILPGNYFLSAAAVELIHPVLAAANETGALLMVHPGLMAGEQPPGPYADNSILRASALNLQASLSHMTLTIIAAGLFDAYPNVTFHVVNLGGTLPFILERIDAIATSRELPAVVTVDHLRRLVYDCASLGPRALELAVSTIGADRIMMGTDYPIFTPHTVRDTVRCAGISDTAKASILYGTAKFVLARYT